MKVTQPKPIRTVGQLERITVGDVVEFVSSPEQPALGIAVCSLTPSRVGEEYVFYLRDRVKRTILYELSAKKPQLRPTPTGKVEFRGDYKEDCMRISWRNQREIYIDARDTLEDKGQ